jgi:hypothetical protein
LLDGTRTFAELATGVARFSAEKGLAVTVDDVTYETEDDIRGALATGIERLLRGLLWDGLLVG